MFHIEFVPHMVTDWMVIISWRNGLFKKLFYAGKRHSMNWTKILIVLLEIH